MRDHTYEEATPTADNSPEIVRWVATCAVIVMTACSAGLIGAAETAPQVEIRADGATLARTLERLVGGEGIEVKVSEEIDDLVSGRLVGSEDDLVELLVDTHRLTVHRDGKTIWFDRKDRPVVDFVKLETDKLVAALKALASPALPGGTVVVEADNRGLVLSGTRAYVEASLARIALATGQLMPELSLSPEQRVISPSTEAGHDGSGGPDGPGGSKSLSGEPDLGEAVSASGDNLALMGLPGPVDVSSPSVPVLSLREAETRDVLGARIVLVSSAEPQAVILADGRELQAGGTLPNGHRIVTIERDRLVLARDGSATIVAMP